MELKAAFTKHLQMDQMASGYTNSAVVVAGPKFTKVYFYYLKNIIK